MLTLRAAVEIVLLLSAEFALTIPLDSADNNPPPTDVIFVTDVITSEMNIVETAIVIASPNSISLTSISSDAFFSSAEQTIPPFTTFSSSPISATSSLAPVVVTEVFTVTATITEPASTTTLSEPAETITEIITAPPSAPSPNAYFQSTWSAPEQISDLSPFNISSFAYGQTNLQVVNGIPATASAVTIAASPSPTETSESDVSAPLTWDNSSSILQLLYPEDSINPGTEPQGGADFYATPLDLHNASSIALEYSVFFPIDFDWVLAGKLPGIFGGHKGCSGGDDAQTCFSTRLMWRENGIGELYLYAPKDKQTKNLCSTPPLSVCNADYGLSIGRGSFSFTPGTWTHVKQIITLNTPGQQDGGFHLEVNGRSALHLSDVFYRDSQSIPPGPVAAPDLDKAPGVPPPSDQPTSESPATTPSAESSPASQPSESSGSLNGLLGSLFGGLMYRVTNSPARQFFMLREEMDGVYFSPSTMPNGSSNGPISDYAGTNDSVTTTTITYTQTSTAVTTLYEPYSPTYYPGIFGLMHVYEPARFIGLFFSTFFGGHDSRYATPRDQYAWFKDFAMTVNPQPQPSTTRTNSVLSSTSSTPVAETKSAESPSVSLEGA